MSPTPACSGRYRGRLTLLLCKSRKLLDEEVEKVRSAGGTVAQAHLSMGRAAPEIVALAEEIETGLIVIGSRGRSGMRRALMGGVSDSVVHHAHCPVLVVRGPKT